MIKINKRIFLASPHMSEEGFEQEYIKEAFDLNWIAPLGKNVNMFEKEIEEYIGESRKALALDSGTSAIHMAIKLSNIKKGDIVFCSSLTFAASCNPIIYEGGIPVFIDSEEETMNMCPEALIRAFKVHKAKAVVVVNLYGQSANMEKIVEICKENDAILIEDAAESLGATYKGRQSGTFGDYGIFSFNGNKIITTSGGGMLITKTEKEKEKAKFWATQSRDNFPYYQHSELGYNYRLSNISAGIGRGQLKVLNKRIEKKKYIFERYKKGFINNKNLNMMNIVDEGESNYWLSVALLNKNVDLKPEDIIKKLNDNNIESRYLWKPMHLQPFYSESEYFTKDEGKDISKDLFERGICLPSDTKMTDEEIDKVIKLINGGK